MDAMDKDWFGVFLTSKWTSVLINKAAFVRCQLSIFCTKKKNLVIGLIVNDRTTSQIVLKIR